MVCRWNGVDGNGSGQCVIDTWTGGGNRVVECAGYGWRAADRKHAGSECTRYTGWQCNGDRCAVPPPPIVQVIGRMALPLQRLVIGTGRR